MKWASLVDAKALLDFFEYIRRRRISPQGRLQKMERLGDAHKYMRFCARANKDTSTLSTIEGAEECLSKWKTILRREKKKISAHRLEQTANTIGSLSTINPLMQSVQLREDFEEVVAKVSSGRVSRRHLYKFNCTTGSRGFANRRAPAKR